jgi:hypothetical protein
VAHRAAGFADAASAHFRSSCRLNPKLFAQIVAIAKPCQDHTRDYDVRVRDIATLLIHLLTTVARLLRPGGARSVVAESLLLRQQLLILNRGRQQAPNLKLADRLIAALCCGWTRSARLRRVAIVLKPATLLAFHRALVKRKYRVLFSPKRHGIPGPKGPSAELIGAPGISSENSSSSRRTTTESALTPHWAESLQQQRPKILRVDRSISRSIAGSLTAEGSFSCRRRREEEFATDRPSALPAYTCHVLLSDTKRSVRPSPFQSPASGALATLGPGEPMVPHPDAAFWTVNTVCGRQSEPRQLGQKASLTRWTRHGLVAAEPA